MSIPQGLEELLSSWLPKAERWVELEREKTIEALAVCYQSKVVSGETAWASVPAFYQKRFGSCGSSYRRASDGRILTLAVAGDLASWRSLFAACGRLSRTFAKLENEAEAFNSLDNFEWWLLLNFTYAQCGAIGAETGGKRQNLDRGFKIEFNSTPLNETRFYVDESSGCPVEFQQALKQSAFEYGYFATITDLRLSTIASIRWMQETASQIHKQRSQQVKQSGPRLLPPQSRTWEEAAKLAKAKFDAEIEHGSPLLRTCLMKLADLWFDILRFDGDSDHYTQFADNIESIWYWYFTARRKWDECKSDWPNSQNLELCTIPCTSVADGAIEFFDLVVVDVLDSVRGQAKLTNDKSIDQDWAIVFCERLRSHLDRIGIGSKPLDGLSLVKRLERDLPTEAVEAESNCLKAESGLTAETQERSVYEWPKEYENDKWIYENIHIQTFDDLSVNHKIEGNSKHWKVGFSRNQYKARADRFADFHGFIHRRFNTAG